MIIYLDVLLFLNAVTDYFILLASSFFANRKLKEWRLIAASLVSAAGSLYIFAPKIHFLSDMTFKLTFSLFITFLTFGFKNIRAFLKAFFCFAAVSLLYCGAAVLLWTVFKPQGMIIKNSVVYFDISVTQMLLFTVIGYVLIRVIRFFISRTAPYSRRVDLLFCNDNTTLEISAMVDSGNSLKDIYQNRKVVITDQKTAGELFCGFTNKPPLLLPYKTINEEGLIRAYPCQSVRVNGKKINNILVAVGKCEFNDDYRAIVSPDILED